MHNDLCYKANDFDKTNLFFIYRIAYSLGSNPDTWVSYEWNVPHCNLCYEADDLNVMAVDY